MLTGMVVTMLKSLVGIGTLEARGIQITRGILATCRLRQFPLRTQILRKTNPLHSLTSRRFCFTSGHAGGGPNANGVDYDNDFNANGIPDGREYDRTPSTNPNEKWRSGPPNGAVTLQDVSIALAQVGTNCN